MTGGEPRDLGKERSPDPASGSGPPPAGTCPRCHRTRQHQEGCDLAALPVRDASALGYEAALARARALADGDYPLAPPAAPGVYGLGAQPPSAPTCPACHHTRQHQPGCPLTPLPVEDAAALGYGAALARVQPQGGYGPPPMAATCPACHHTRQHQPGCPLTPLPVEDAAALGHDAALARVRGQDDGRYLPVPGAPAAAAAACPGCHHTIRHRRGCTLELLPVDDAALLGYDAALDRIHALLAAVPLRGAPPPADACPGCHHTRRHGPGCELAALTVAEASALGHRAALDRVRARAAAGGGEPPPPPVPPPGGLRGWLRRLAGRD